MSEKVKNPKIVLLDAHAILHRAYHALPEFASAKGEPTGALYGLSTMLIKIIEDLKPDYVIACYDVKGPTYRHEAYKDYKFGRKAAEDDLISQMKRSREIFDALNIPIYDKEGFEADDMLGTIVEQTKDKDLDIVIASGDMDTLQLVNGKKVQVYTLKKGIKDTVMYDEEGVKARYGFGPEHIADYKGLRGDPSDNIMGVKGIGEKTATTLIQTFGTIEAIYKELDAGHEDKFEKAGIKPRIVELLKANREEAEFSKMLATIRRDSPISFNLPEKKFKENLDIKKVNSLWHQMEFRTLTARLEKVLSLDASKSKKKKDEGEKETIQPTSSMFADRTPVNVPDDSDLEKTCLALWLVNSTITNPKLDDVLNFADTNDFEVAKKAVFAELEARQLRRVYETIELPLIPVIRKMEKRGIKIDRKRLSNLAKTYHEELSRLEKSIWELCGVEFNINSPKQLGEVLFDKLGLKGKNMKKTGAGARSTRESELEKLRDLHPSVPLLFEYRELQKLLSTYIDAIPPLLDENDRLHTHFIPSGTTTGRMASQNPNLQNIPIKSELGRAIRGAFVAESGYVLAGFDYSQVELRVAAILSGDPKLLDIFKRGEDVHASVASSVFKVPMDKVTAGMRRQAKVINFGIIYGMGVMALRQNLGTSREEAQNFLDQYFETFSVLAKYLDQVKKETAKKGFTETLFGRRRYIEGINSRIPYIKAEAERMAINAPVQGTGADIMKMAMIKLDKFIQDESLSDAVFPLLQVHDELIFEIKKERYESVAPKIQSIMESIVDPDLSKGVILRTSSGYGLSWQDLK